MFPAQAFFYQVAIPICCATGYKLCYKAGKEKQRTYYHRSEGEVKTHLVGKAKACTFRKALYDKPDNDNKTCKEGKRAQTTEKVHRLLAEPADELNGQKI